MPYKHGRRKKHRTHKDPVPGADSKIPQSLVLRRGKVGNAVKELVQDFRRMMMPHTATKLREQGCGIFQQFALVCVLCILHDTRAALVPAETIR
jgi:hypothetical protein